jgi:hypothetical protein
LNAAGQFWRQPALWIGVLLITIGATIPRFFAVEQMTVFVDEIYWIIDGHEALERMRDPNPPPDVWGPRILRHPGVPAAMAGGLAEDTRDVAADRVAENERIIRLARLGVVWMGILCCMIVALLGARLYGLPTGLLAGAILATSPSHVANSAWLHHDSPLTLFSFVSVLSLILHRREGGTGWLVLSAISAGLAIASKLPGLVLGLYAAAVCLTVPVSAFAELPRRAGQSLRELTLWSLLALLTLYAAWPRMWTNPLAMIDNLLWARSLAESHLNYFMGEISSAPPWYYYLVVVPFSFNEIEFVGLIGGVAWVAWWWHRRGVAPSRETLLLVAWALTFLLFMSIGGKKLGARYVLPLWPIATLLVARFGVLATGHLRELSTGSRLPVVGIAASVSALVVIAGLASTRGDFHAYANRLLGGLPAKEKVTLVVGVAERDVARYLDSLPDPAQVHIAGHLLSTQWHARRAVQSAPCEGLNPGTQQTEAPAFLVVYSHYEKRCPAYAVGALDRLGAREVQQFVWARTVLARVYQLPR